MTLRNKTLLIIAGAIVLLATGLYLISTRIVIGRFEELEQSHTQQDVHRAQDTLADDALELGRLTNDWANWDDTYIFIEDRNQAFITSNLELDTSYINNRLSLMIFLNSAGEMVFGNGFDINEEQFAPLPPSIFEYLKPGGLLLATPETAEGINGIIMLPEGPMLVASELILTSESEGPARGSLIWGRYLDEQQIGHLAEIMHLTLSAQRVDEPLPPDFQQALARITAGEASTVMPLGDDLVAGYGVVSDISGDPALLLRVDNTREIFNQGLSTRNYLITGIIAAILTFTLITVFTLERWVLAPVARLSADVRRIGERGDHAERVKTSGNDELSLLARVINKMLSALQESQTKLKDINEELEMRVEQRTEDLIDKVVALQALAEIDREVIASIKSPAVLDLACCRTAEVLHVDKTLIFLTQQPAGKGIAAGFGIDASPEVETELSSYLVESVKREPDLLEKGAYGLAELPEGETFFPLLIQTEGIRAMAAAPLFAEGNFLGAIFAFDTRLHQWTDDEIRILGLIGAQVALAIEQSRLFEQEQERREELSSLYGLSRLLADASPSVDEILKLVTRHAVEKVHVTFASVAMIEEDRFVMRAAFPVRSLGVDLLAGPGLEISSDSVFRRTVDQEKPLIVREDDQDLTAADRAFLLLDKVSHLCLVPLRAGSRPLGVLMLGESRKEDREPFAEEKIRLAYSIGDQTVSALQRADLFSQLEHSYLETVLSLASAVEAKDTYTADHAESLASMAVAVGQKLGMTSGELDDLRYGAILHDVGKIGVPDVILRKPGSLSSEEWVEMRKHPAVGAQILAPVPRLAKASGIVRYHHERFDGDGYPDGLSGQDIPLGARILTVVDSYSAIIDKRVYKEARSQEEAIAELRRCSGTQFDPQAVEVFTGMLESGEIKSEAASQGGDRS